MQNCWIKLRTAACSCLVILALVTVGCKRKPRKALAIKPDSTITDTSTSANLRLKDFGGVRNLDFLQISFKGRGSFANAESEMGFAYTIRVARGNVVWASVSVLGIEGARLLATPDSFKVLDRLNSKYIAKGYGYLEEKFGLRADFNLLQDMVLGNANGLTVPTGMVGEDAQYEHSAKQLLLSYFVSLADGKLRRVEANDVKLGPVSRLYYGAFGQVEGQPLPMQLSVDLWQPKQGRLILEHREVQLHTDGLSFPFTIPSGYDEVR